ncbi:MAG: hypothetical protein QGG55_02725, partial [Verrucomicrobiota bacterium]|nr:hypothetical protein [Verrucomicrobiota bacterium]
TELVYHKPMIRRIFITACLLGLFTWQSVSSPGGPEVSRDVRNKAAATKLKGQKAAALLYVKGMT